MIRFLATIRLIAGAATLAGSLVAAHAASAADARTLPMRFDLRQEGPADRCGNHCRSWISASGAITADTPRDFASFANGKDIQGATLVLDSDGGSVLGALALGREIRRLDLTTTVGRTNELPTGDRRAALDPRADCESMCAFVLLAGARRHVPADARVMVHQIWLGDRRDDPTAASYSAEDLVLVQRDIGRIAQFISEMGASAELLDIALRIPPWEPMHLLTRDELQRLQFLTVENPFDRASGSPVASGAVTSALAAVTVVQKTPLPRRAWALVDGANGTAISRRHPLTIEGEEIGAFDLTVTCGRDPDTYNLSYSEWRHGRDADRPPPSLTYVTVMLGHQALALQVTASAPSRTDGTELATAANGNVRSDLVKNFAALSNRSLTITTSSAGPETSIRIGNAGIAQNFPLFASSCEQSLTAKADIKPDMKSADRPRTKTGALAHAD